MWSAGMSNAMRGTRFPQQKVVLPGREKMPGGRKIFCNDVFADMWGDKR
ncbi:hypothetical protein DCCM_4252 [Desulfocucumis palustris]|uniref:Uncharacterized protein n=1 Tax=Desulfocucumis palustris TaxID=1898651 RepID=A0A2L2XFK6_9FIRM|nr:hypothetical protein DCCM_4252 [Desulfocucumis palustris]